MRAGNKPNLLVKYRDAERVRVGATKVTVRLLTEAERDEIATYVHRERKSRIAKGEKFAPTKECRGCELPFPLTLAFFHCRTRKGHKPYWYPYCRTCKQWGRDRKPKLNAAGVRADVAAGVRADVAAADKRASELVKTPSGKGMAMLNDKRGDTPKRAPAAPRRTGI